MRECDIEGAVFNNFDKKLNKTVKTFDLFYNTTTKFILVQHKSSKKQLTNCTKLVNKESLWLPWLYNNTNLHNLTTFTLMQCTLPFSKSSELVTVAIFLT